MTNNSAIETAKQIWEEEDRKRKRRLRMIRYTTFGLTALSIPVLLIYSFGHMLSWWGKLSDVWQVFLISSQFLLIIGMLSDWMVSRKQLTAIGNLTETDDVHAVGPLISSLELAHYPKGAIFDTLIRLLPRMNAEEWRLISTDQKRILYHTLAEDYQWNDVSSQQWDTYRVVTLKAIERFGDTKALPFVTKLTEKRADTDSEREIQATARICQSTLFALSKSEQINQTLLRATTKPEDRETLLRITTKTDTEKQALLRSVCSDKE